MQVIFRHITIKLNCCFHYNIFQPWEEMVEGEEGNNLQKRENPLETNGA